MTPIIFDQGASHITSMIALYEICARVCSLSAGTPIITLMAANEVLIGGLEAHSLETSC